MSRFRLTNLRLVDVGRYVIYKPGVDNQYGRIKSFNNTTRRAVVVYSAGDVFHTNNRWKSYTGASTKYEDLMFAN